VKKLKTDFGALSKSDLVITKPEIAKKISTPTKPPGRKEAFR
jgi:hypothetical protein